MSLAVTGCAEWIPRFGVDLEHQEKAVYVGVHKFGDTLAMMI